MTYDGQRIADAALSLVGVTFEHQGRNPDVGLDCVGVALASVERAGYPVPHVPAAYPIDVDANDVLDQISEHCDAVSRLQPGDFVTVKLPLQTWARHVAVAVDSGYVAMDPFRKFVRVVPAAEYRNRLAGFWRLRQWQ